MSGSIPIQIRGTPGNGPPVGLVERQLAVEMNNGNLWVGVPVSIDSTGRVQLNPRRVPAGGAQFEVLTKGTGTALGWAAAGDVGGNNTAIGASALTLAGSANLSNNLALGWGALQMTGAAGVSAGNVGIGERAGGRFGPQGAPVTLTTVNNGVYLGANTQALANAQTNEVVIGANTTGHGSNTATIGADSGPNAMTQFWVGGRDLLAIGEPPPFGMASGALTAVPNDGSVHDVCSGLFTPGLWLCVVRVWMATASSTPWWRYGAGMNWAPGQATIIDSYEWATSTGTAFSVAFSQLNIFHLAAPAMAYGCVFATNSTNAGTYDCSVYLEPFQLGP